MSEFNNTIEQNKNNLPEDLKSDIGKSAISFDELMERANRGEYSTSVDVDGNEVREAEVFPEAKKEDRTVGQDQKDLGAPIPGDEADWVSPLTDSGEHPNLGEKLRGLLGRQ